MNQRPRKTSATQTAAEGISAGQDQPLSFNELESFFSQISAVLPSQEGADAELSAILTEHLLTVRPAANCVEKAKDAILKLAAKRAAPPTEKSEDA